jgi:LysR family transcriptional activator of nhaA
MNLKHLYYFWATAKSGGIVRAGEQLHITPQTLSGQIKLLEAQMGCALFRKAGRRLELTEAGRVALGYADQIFALSGELDAAIGKARGGQATLDFRVGISDSVPKAIAYRLLEPALGLPEPVRLICHEGAFESLLAQIAVHHLDLVIADQPMGKQMSVKAFNHALGVTAMSFFAAPRLKGKLKRGFPHCLDRAPMLLQGASSAMRQRLDVWLAQHQLHPHSIGEFDDTALMNAFGGEGRGVFMGPTALEAETCAQYGVRVLGRTSELVEEYFAISVERRITHPCVVAITQAARTELFSA